MRKALFLSVVLLSSSLFAQQPAANSPDVQTLLKRIEQLENRVHELEARAPQTQVGTPATTSTDSTPSPDTTTGAAAGQSAASIAFKEEVDKDSALKIRGFGQVSFLGSDIPGSQPAYNTGNLTLLLSSRLSNKLSALAEIALDEEGNGGPTFSTVLERAVLQYEHNDALKITAGRYFSSIGYYNTAYYNADWAQTALRRPIIAAFQDDGGLAPMQRNGISFSGKLPSGGLGLHYVAEVGGGDNVRGGGFGVGEIEMQARTGFNFALFARPRALPGVQIGGSIFHDTETPLISGVGDPRVRQNIFTAYAVYNNTRWEFLNEAYLVRHSVTGGREYNIPAFYTQLSHRLTPALRPYFRFTYVNGAQNDPMLPDVVGRQTGIEGGARYNFTEWIGMKFEYDRTNINVLHKSFNFGGTQLVFTF